MLTPAFELSQDHDFITVVIKTPYVKISEVDFFIDGSEFKFHVKPYFLRLNLPGKIVEDGREGASYDVKKGTFTVKLPKLHPGEHFEGLDMLTSLLAPRKITKTNSPLIEVINDDPGETGTGGDSSDEASDFNWEIEQVLCKDEVLMELEGVGEGEYGFANKKSGIFEKRQEELYEIADIRYPESMTVSERRLARLTAEDLKFDPDYYLADFFDKDNIQQYLNYSPPWNQQHDDYIHIKDEPCNSTCTTDKQLPKEMSMEELVPFTQEEKDKLRKLPNKEYLLDDQVQLSLLLGLVDIVFAYAYNHRTTEGENTVESAWTINKISSTFCYFETFTNLSDVICACCRRCLSYPLYRNWDLVQHVLEDTKKIFTLGRRRLLKCLLEIHGLFSEDDPRFILNDLYITEYCVWIQTTSSKKLKSLAQMLQKIQANKTDVGWQLDELEKAAILAEEDNTDSDSESGREDTSSSSSSDTDSGDPSSEEELEIQIGNLTLSPERDTADETGTKDLSVNDKIVELSSTTF